jgi:hypothetical protein
MFEFLETIPTEQVLSAAYFASRLITHRKSIENYLKASPVKGVRSEPSPKEADLGRQIVSEILTREDTDMDGLTRDAASKYLSELLDIVYVRLAREAGPRTSAKSRRVLDKWRSAAAKSATVQ